jgi:hypothetical protein
MVRGVVAAVFAGLVLGVAPGVALASSQDVAETQKLASATNTLVSAATPEVPHGLAAAKSFASRVAAECPGAAAGSPQNEESEQLDNEVIASMTIAGYHVAAAPVARFARAVRGLHWSNGRLTRAVQRLAKRLVGLTRLTPANICGDIKTWAAGGYQTVPASTLAFEKRYFATDPEAEEVPLIIQLSTPYATPSDIPVLKRVERLEVKLGEAEAAAVESYSRLIIALELRQ